MEQSGSEWVGGRRQMPGYVLEDGPYRPEILLWMEFPSELVVWTEVVDPAQPVALAGTLGRAMARPLAGPSRRPARVRVADAELATELRGLHPEITVTVGPTPELDGLMATMASAMSADEEPTYLEDGRFSVEDMQDLFAAAEQLWHVAPWRLADDDHVLRVDVPALQVEGACLSIIGFLGESFGFLLFPSRAGYEAFGAPDEEPRLGTEEHALPEPVDLGTSFISLTYERGAAVSPSMRREVARHGWPVAGPEAYPRLDQRDRDGVARPLVLRDVRLVAAIARSLASCFIKHGAAVGRDLAEPICESWYGDDDMEVRFTAPYEAAALFEPPTPPWVRTTPQVGRNAPCPCGSGRKYKKCCLGRDDAPGLAGAAGGRVEAAAGVRPGARSALDVGRPAPIHETDERLVTELSAYAARRFGRAWQRAGAAFADPAAAVALLVPWVVYGFQIDGRRVVDWFLDAPDRRLDATERSWLEAQRRAWLSVWEVVTVEPGRSVTVADQLSGVVRTVQEVSASQTLSRRDTVLARVVDHGGISVFCGLHPRGLPPLDAGAVLERARGRLRLRRAVPVERLRDGAFGRYLIKRWEEAVAVLDERRRHPPELRNTDGDPLLPTRARFTFDDARRDEVVVCLGSVEGVQPPEPDGETAPCFTIVRAGNAIHVSWDTTILGMVRVGMGELWVETNSTRRADAIGDRVEAACGDLVRRHTTEYLDPCALRVGDDGDESFPAASVPLREAGVIVRAFKARHYCAWADEPLPALGCKSPRAAVRTPGGRRRVDTLLKDMEFHETQLPAGERFDFAVLRGDLGLQ